MLSRYTAIDAHLTDGWRKWRKWRKWMADVPVIRISTALQARHNYLPRSHLPGTAYIILFYCAFLRGNEGSGLRPLEAEPAAKCWRSGAMRGQAGELFLGAFPGAETKPSKM